MNFILAPLLIFGLNSFEGLGLKGASISSLISYLISFVVGYFLLRKKRFINPLFRYDFDKKIIWETLKIGFPYSLNGVAFSFIYVFVSRFVADYGTIGLASMGIEHRVESLIYQTTSGFSLGATVLVGQQIGANNPHRAEIYAWKTFGYSLFLVIPYSLLMIFFSAPLASIFTTDVSVINGASLFIEMTGYVLIFSASEVIFGGAFSGAGDTVPPAVIGMVINFLRIPLAGLFSYLWGLNGIWLAIVLSVFLK